jgi:cytochrome c biogenesis protein ResB
MRLILALASLKFTPVGLILLGVAAIPVFDSQYGATMWLAGPLLLLAVNLICAVATNGVFRKQMPLLVFHLALIALVLLAAAGRLMYLKGTAELTEGTAFTGLKSREAGPLHIDRVADVHFVNDGFRIDYMAGPILDHLVNRVRWAGGDGTERVADIELNKPLTLLGYRIYPTSNKGFAPVFLWQLQGGEALLASVHLPSYPAHATGQAETWRLPGTQEEVWLMLEVEEGLIADDKPSQFRLPAQRKLVLRHRDQRMELQPGQRISVAGGTLEYRELRTWMGYRFYHDWTIPWMLAACALGAVSLSWHYWRRFASTPWNKDN